MSAQIADFNIRFNADSATFNKDVGEIKKNLWKTKAAFEAANDGGNSFTRTLSDGADKSKKFAGGITQVAGAVTAGLGMITGAAGMLIRSQAEVGKEFQKMATVAGITVEQIQALGYATEQYGIPADKMADIIKDVNDKLGEFVSVGTGGFVDFFEKVAPKVGLTAQELQRLSGPDVLIAVKNAMDAANIPMREQTFYLEAIASDATALMPLLANNGSELKKLTKHYDNLNVAMSEYDIEQFKKMDQVIEDTSRKLERSFSVAVLGAHKQITWLSNEISEAVTWWGTQFDTWNDKPRTADGLINKLGDLRSEVRQTKGLLAGARSELSELETTQKNAEGNLAAEAHLANAGWDKRITNAKSKVADLTAELSQLEKQINQHQTQYENQVFGFNRNPNSKNKKGKPQPGLLSDTPPRPPLNDDGITSQNRARNTLDALDMKYASELEKLQLSHSQRLAEIEKLQVSEQEIKQRGYESLTALKQEYVDRENEFATQQQEGYFQQLDEKMQLELDTFARQEEQKNLLSERAAKQRAETEKRLEQQVLAMKYGVASQGLGLIEQTAKKGSGIQKAAFLAQQMMAAAQVFQQGEVAAMAALAPPPIGLGPIAGVGQAATIRVMSGISMGMIMGQALAGMAHDGLDSVPREGTWLLNKGERVYTNQSVKKLDRMYEAVNGGRGVGGSVVINQEFHVSGTRDSELESMMQAAAKQGAQQGYAKVVQDLRSNGAIKQLTRR